MSLRLLLMYMIVPIGIIVILFRPFWGAVMLSLMYFMRPQIWGMPDWMQPVLFFSIAIMVALAIRYRQIKFPLSVVLALGMLAMMTVSSFLAVASSAVSFDQNITVLKLILAMVFMVNFVRTPKEMTILLWTFVVGILWMNKAAIVYYLTTGVQQVGGIGGQSGDSNYLALCITMTLPFLIVKASSTHKLEKLIAMGLSGIWLFALILTGSRAGFVALLVTAVFLFLRMQRRLVGAAVLGLLVMLFVLMSPAYYWERMGTITDYREEVSAASRLAFWQAGMRMFRDHPVTGIGQGNFILLSPIYVPEFVKISDGEETGFVTHNTFVQTLAEGGVQSLVLFLLLFGVSFLYLRRAKALPASHPDHQTLHNLATSIELALLAFLINAFFGSYILIDFIYWYLGCAAALYLMAKERLAEAAAPIPAVTAQPMAAYPAHARQLH